ncbi:HU family DNA-binding protein [Paenibacillus rhizovicinus]|uniref:HU family DNA-binding protein n=1 Tax=Paenibacillus rhizovicinus TaxID=2704463 RepID=A0A6C0P8L8_9BACL|nr:HU family DNA-binding protein [Paenibacillus rhizovicinus]QHW34894.1 HU family DNA-binding protein [Paenibacillus rhizovicinus]
MNKEQLVEEVAKSGGFSKKNAEKAVTCVLDSILQALKDGREVQLVGFGKFEVRYRDARMGRSRATGEEVELPAGKVPVFTAGIAMKQALNAPKHRSTRG